MLQCIVFCKIYVEGVFLVYSTYIQSMIALAKPMKSKWDSGSAKKKSHHSLTSHCSTKLRNSLQLNFHMLEHPLLLYIDMASGADLASMAPNNAMSLSGDQMRLSTSSLDDTNKTRWGIFVISLSQAGGWIPSYLIILKKLVVGSHHISSFSIDHFSSI